MIYYLSFVLNMLLAYAIDRLLFPLLVPISGISAPAIDVDISTSVDHVFVNLLCRHIDVTLQLHDEEN